MPVLKPYAQTVLKRLGLKERLKVSWVFDAYGQITHSRRIHVRNKEVLFYRNVLRGFRPGDLIFDVGANAGEKTEVFLKLGGRVVAVEPDERNQEVLREKFLKYRLTPRPVEIVGRAVSDRIAIETMWIDGPGSALNTFSKKWVDTLRGDKKRFPDTLDNLDFAQKKEVRTTTLEELISAHGLPFFVKIDVEGHELSVLRGLQHPIPYLSFEVNLPEFRPEGLQCLEILRQLDAAGMFNYAVDCEGGFGLKEWLGPEEFCQVLNRCTDKGIEVFWRASLSN